MAPTVGHLIDSPVHEPRGKQIMRETIDFAVNGGSPATRLGPIAAILVKILDEAASAPGTDTLETGFRAAVRIAERDYGSAREPGGTAAPVRGGLAPWQVRVVNAFIHDHLGEKIRQDDLARMVSLSPSYFAVAFKRSYGVPPHAHLIRCRIERAQEMMRTTDEPLSQIALACGLGDQSHLSNLFRSRIGLSPNAWRRQQSPSASLAPSTERHAGHHEISPAPALRAVPIRSAPTARSSAGWSRPPARGQCRTLPPG